MADETIETAPEIELGFDVAALPATPWTLDGFKLRLGAAEGSAKFRELATICGAGVSESALGASLDPRKFALGVGNKLIADLTLDPQGPEADAIRARAEAVQAQIDATLPEATGTERAEGAPPLRPSITKKSERKF